ncbi:AsnC family transcriptional regulator [Streptomyces sp. NPDC002573]
MDLDALDRALLRELQTDARRTNRDLAASCPGRGARCWPRTPRH